jgi:hypothetical protein
MQSHLICFSKRALTRIERGLDCKFEVVRDGANRGMGQGQGPVRSDSLGFCEEVFEEGRFRRSLSVKFEKSAFRQAA